MNASPVWRIFPRGGLCAILALSLCPVFAGDLTDDQLEYGTRTKDRRFMHNLAEEAVGAFNAPFNLLADGQASIQKATGIRLYFDYYGVFLGNPVGGASQSAAYSHEIVVGGHFDLEKIAGWQGAMLTASFAEGAGSNLSAKINNYFIVSESYVQDTGVLFDLYLTQKLFDDTLDLRVGRMSAGQMFATIPAFGLQVNGGINGNPNNLFSNAPFHAGITSTWAAMIKYKPTKETYLSGGIFQATPRLGVYAYHGLDFSIRPDDGFLMMFEAGWKPTFGASGAKPVDGGKSGKAPVEPERPGLPGLYKMGGYFSTYPFEQFSGGTEMNQFGFYAIGQQMVWRSARDSNHNFTVWGGVIYSPQSDLAMVPLMGCGGTIWQGLIPGRNQDQWLTCWLIGDYSSAYGNSQQAAGYAAPTYETVFETSYVIQLNKYMSVQPDIQYVVRPGGLGSIPNALVIGLQAVVSF